MTTKERRQLLAAGCYQVRGVLAGAYLTEHALSKMVNHILVNSDNRTLCRRVIEERLCDVSEPGPATCPECLRRLNAATASVV